jgi:hypothetical protein
MEARYLVKGQGLTFWLKERVIFSGPGKVQTRVIYNNEVWHTTTAASPVGGVATKLSAEYEKNPAALAPKAEEEAVMTAPVSAVPSTITLPAVSALEVKQAVDDGRIKERDKNGSKTFLVRDTHAVYYMLSKHHMTVDFLLYPHGDYDKQERLIQFSVGDTRAGTHNVKRNLSVKVEGREWVLTPMSYNQSGGGYASVLFEHLYKMPDTLTQELLATKGGVTLSWQYMFGSEWKTYEYTVPPKIVRDIQLMYAGIK